MNTKLTLKPPPQKFNLKQLKMDEIVTHDSKAFKVLRNGNFVEYDLKLALLHTDLQMMVYLGILVIRKYLSWEKNLRKSSTLCQDFLNWPLYT